MKNIHMEIWNDGEKHGKRVYTYAYKKIIS
jgi:hypothetical protein